MNTPQLAQIARALVADGKGLLAMDESNGPATSDSQRRAFLKPRRPAAPIGS
jgi:fructose-bisphosphate aldolase class 1